MSLSTPFIIGETPINRPALLEASAGTGKTYTLIRIVRDLIAKEGKSLSEILVVTFTKKAVQELKDRIRDILENPIDDTVKTPYTEEELARLQEAALAADEAPIFTMHGFCKGVLQSFPFECRSEFKLEISETEDLLPEVILDYIREIEGSTNLSTPSLIFRCWETSLRKAGSFDNAMESMENVVSRLMNTPSANILPRDVIVDKDISEIKYKELIDQFSTKAKTEEKKETEKQKHKESVELALFEAALWAEIPRRLSKRKEEEGIITFNDMIDRLYQLLRSDHQTTGDNTNDSFNNNNSGELLVEALRRQYSVLLIDEFQDTDTRQWTIFQRIFDHDKGVFFLIGDPKQSIYGFRGTELQVYHDAARTIPKDRHYLLPTNFRSTPDLTGGINTLFQPIFSRNFSGKRIEFIPVETGSKAKLLQKNSSDSYAIKDSHAIEFLPFQKLDEKGIEAAKTGVDEIREYYDNTIVAQIIELLSGGYTIFDKDQKKYRPLQPEDIAILAETNNRLSAVETLLLSYGIPSNNAKSKSIVETPEAADIIFLLNVLSNPSDQAVLKAALLLPLFGLSLSALLFLDERSLLDRVIDRFHLWHKEIITGSFIEVTEEILTFGELLGEILTEGGYAQKDGKQKDGKQNDGKQNEEKHKEEIKTVSLPYRERILSYAGGERIYTNTIHLIEILYRAIRFKGVALEDLADYLRDELKLKTDSESDGEESGIRVDKEAKGVTLITIHSSKGLEFPVVFFHAGYGEYTKKSPQTFLRDNDKSRSICLFENPEMKDQAMFYQWEEKKRLYYVAMTRPSSKLYLPLISTPTRSPSLLQAFYNEAFPEFSRDLITQGILKEDKAFPMLGGFGEKVQSKYKKEVKLADFSQALYQHIVAQVKKDSSRFCLGSGSENSVQKKDFRYTQEKMAEIAINLTSPQFKTSPVDFSRRTIPVLSYSALTANHSYDHEAAPETTITSDKERDIEIASANMVITPSDQSGEESEEDRKLKEEILERNKILGAGPEFGTMVHNIFERIDLYLPSSLTTIEGWAKEKETESVIEEEITRFYPPERLKPARPLLLSMVYSTLTTPLTPLDGKPLCSQEITPFIKELEFLIKIKSGSRLEGQPIPAVSQKEGFLKGYIDLIFRYKGKVYIADWKTNLCDGYGPEQLKGMMADHRYDLQFKIYQTALISYLEKQGPFSYNDFGGVFYFFVRGMDGKDDKRGVFFDRLDEGEFRAFKEGLIG